MIYIVILYGAFLAAFSARNVYPNGSCSSYLNSVQVLKNPTNDGVRKLLGEVAKSAQTAYINSILY